MNHSLEKRPPSNHESFHVGTQNKCLTINPNILLFNLSKNKRSNPLNPNPIDGLGVKKTEQYIL